MAGLALPKFRWLLAGALAAGVWVVREDMKTPRPPERVGAANTQRTTQAKPKPPMPLTGKPTLHRTALNLPKAVARPPMRPQKIVTGSIEKPVKLRLAQTTTKMRLRAQAKATAPVVATLEAGRTVRELARSGKWRLVLVDGRKGWVHGDYLVPPRIEPRRPARPVSGSAIKHAKASMNAKQGKTQ